MTFEEFAARFRKPDDATRSCAPAAAGGADFVAVAARVLSVVHDECLIDVNGVQYEISPVDIADIQRLSTATAPSEDKEDDGREFTSTEVMLLKIDSNAVLCRRVPVRVGLVAAAGTWVSIVPSAPEGAAEQSAETR